MSDPLNKPCRHVRDCEDCFENVNWLWSQLCKAKELARETPSGWEKQYRRMLPIVEAARKVRGIFKEGRYSSTSTELFSAIEELSEALKEYGTTTEL